MAMVLRAIEAAVEFELQVRAEKVKVVMATFPATSTLYHVSLAASTVCLQVRVLAVVSASVRVEVVTQAPAITLVGEVKADVPVSVPAEMARVVW